MTKKTCEQCKYWSEKIAWSIGCGPLEAMCLLDRTKRPKGQYTEAKFSCEHFQERVPIDA